MVLHRQRTMSIPRFAVSSLALVAILALGLECSSSRVEPNSQVAGNDEHGAEIYGRYCALCHGDRGQGYAADNANSLRSPEFLSTVSDEFLRAAILKGRSGTPMSAWGVEYGGPLEPQDVASLVALIRSWQNAPSLALQEGTILGEVGEGSTLFADQCAKCHGPKGEGNTAPSLNDGVFHETASDAFIRHAIAKGRSGTLMPAFEKTLVPKQLDQLTAFVRTLANPVKLPETRQLPDQPIVINPKGAAPEFTLRDDFYVPAAQVKAALEEGKRLVIVDARAESDYLQAHLPGALSVPFYAVEKYAAKLPKDGTWIVAYCACPHAASGRVATALRERGFDKTVVLDEGVRVWIELGYPIETAP